MKLLFALYLLVAIKEAIDFRLSVWEGRDTLVESLAMIGIALFWPPIFLIWIYVKGSKLLKPSPSPKQYQMFAKEK